MPIPEQRDLEKARAVLGEWLAAKLGVDAVGVSEITGPASTGFSNETLIFDASWRNRGGNEHTEGLVVRVKPTTYTVFLESDFEAQYRVLKTLGARTDVPVPTVRWYEEDERVLGAPFFVMERLTGQAPTDNPPYTVTGFVFDATPVQRRKLVDAGFDAMVRIHQLDWRALGLGFLDKPHHGETGADQQLGYYEKSFAWAARGEPEKYPVAAAALAWLRENKPVADGPIALCWGDARIANQMFDDDFDLVAVLDWEMVTLADPVMDLAWWLFLERHFTEGIGLPGSLEGFPAKDELVARWERALGRPAEHLEWYERFAAFRFTVIMMRIGHMLVEFELIPPELDLAANSIPAQLLAKDLGLPAPGPAMNAFDTDAGEG
jgi:aminoglycoside phosphotransferase (APT) family kinase protein